MKILVLDPRNGDGCADLYVMREDDSRIECLRLGYVPELHYDARAHQLVVVETELYDGGSKHWLKCYDADTFQLLLLLETPVRPMYSGFPGRSFRVKSSETGRYLYFLESTIHPRLIDLYRIRVHRYDRQQERMESSPMVIDSCMADFDQFGECDDELCFHLSCEFPSTLAFTRFDSPELRMLQLEEVESRTPSPRETCGSYFSKEKAACYCITGEGAIHVAENNPPRSRLLTKMKLKGERSIPLAQIYQSGDSLLVGVSVDMGMRGLSMASEIWRLDAEDGEVLDVFKLQMPVMNFVTTPGGSFLLGVNPYENALMMLEVATGKTLGFKDKLGISPGEVLLLP